MAIYRKKPIEVNAYQWTGPGMYPSPGVYSIGMGLSSRRRYFVITIHNQRAYLEPGDWVILEPNGVNRYPCKPDIFEKTYEFAREDSLSNRGD